MAGKKQLPPVRVATTDDIPAPPKSLTEAIESGDRLDELKAMRRILVAHMESENALTRDVPPLVRQVRELSKEIESLELRAAEEEVEVLADNGSTDAVWKPTAI